MLDAATPRAQSNTAPFRYSRYVDFAAAFRANRGPEPLARKMEFAWSSPLGVAAISIQFDEPISRSAAAIPSCHACCDSAPAFHVDELPLAAARRVLSAGAIPHARRCAGAAASEHQRLKRRRDGTLDSVTASSRSFRPGPVEWNREAWRSRSRSGAHRPANAPTGRNRRAP